jgi:choline dehydrogenase-like flavoprotein
MRIDLEDAAPGSVFTSDVCVVGGGIAGIILARQLARLGKTVHLLEAGGLDDEPRSQKLYAVEMAGQPYRGATEGRFRTFGGSSTRWAAQMLPYPDEIFQPRAAVGHVGWPISGQDLAPYYAEVHELMQANALPFDETFLRAVGAEPLPESDAVRVRFSKWAPISRRNLGHTVGRECLASDKVTVFPHANALALHFSPLGETVQELAAVNYHGGTATFRARHFVLAAGTLEVSRLLLNSIRLAPPAADHFHDQIGRYFFDHLISWVGLVTDCDRAVYDRLFAPYYRQRNLHTARFESSAAFQERTQTLALMAHFEFEEGEDSGLGAFRRYLHALQGRTEHGPKLSSLPKALWGGARTVYDLKVRGRRLPSAGARLTLRFDAEQRPDPDSRILLAKKPDALGVPQLRLDFRRSEDEARAMFAFAPHMDAFLKAAGMNLEWRPGFLEDLAPWKSLGVDLFHPMGGTRMGLDPRTSVVDPNLQVHGVDDLSIASCATYPTGGSSNPTYSLMALTLRLAERLARG